MIGFELKSSKENLVAGLQEGVTSIIFTRVKSENQDFLDLSFSGLNIEKQENYQWLSRQLEVGEEFVLKVVKIEESSNPEKTGYYPIEKALLEDKLKRYQNLKKELEDAGLI
ncbi:hypothetical protein [Algoriphagus sp.]|jgi:UDP-galactopyranose mutase|uniref:hypothetical protein n=1 Tax=Algoriphagus sp. TaxID=1872435 RepID=UPI00391CB70B